MCIQCALGSLAYELYGDQQELTGVLLSDLRLVHIMYVVYISCMLCIYHVCCGHTQLLQTFELHLHWNPHLSWSCVQAHTQW